MSIVLIRERLEEAIDQLGTAERFVDKIRGNGRNPDEHRKRSAIEHMEAVEDLLLELLDHECDPTQEPPRCFPNGMLPVPPEEISVIGIGPPSGKEVFDFAVTRGIESVVVADGVTRWSYMQDPPPADWPITDPAPDTRIEGNPWIIFQYEGTWYAASWEWLRPFQTEKHLSFWQWPGHIKEPDVPWQPVSGETVYFFVTTHARAGERTSDERSNIVQVTVS